MSDLQVKTMNDEQFSTFLELSIQEYAELNHANRDLSMTQALEESRQVHQDLLPQGTATPQHYLLAAQRNGEHVGDLWLAKRREILLPNRELDLAWIFYIRVQPAFRRQGIGLALMQWLETDVQTRMGVQHIGLFVHRSNPGAKALYDRCAYHVIEAAPSGFVMQKDLAER